MIVCLATVSFLLYRLSWHPHTFKVTELIGDGAFWTLYRSGQHMMCSRCDQPCIHRCVEGRRSSSSEKTIEGVRTHHSPFAAPLPAGADLSSSNPSGNLSTLVLDPVMEPLTINDPRAQAIFAEAHKQAREQVQAAKAAAAARRRKSSSRTDSVASCESIEE